MLTPEQIKEMDYYYGNGFKKEFSFRELFVRYEKDSNSSIVNVTVDGYYASSFQSKANTESDFIKECESVKVIWESGRYRLEFEKE